MGDKVADSAALVILLVPQEYGYVILVAVLSYFLIMYLGFKEKAMERKANIRYSAKFSDRDEVFYYMQGTHLNTLRTSLEIYPQFLILLFVGGLYWPFVASLGGVLWLIGRVVDAHGYHSGDLAKQKNGAIFGCLGLLVMVYCSMRQATSMLG